eukprot:g5030.t1
MSGEYSYTTSTMQMGRMRQMLKRAGYDDEVVDTVIARNSAQEGPAGAFKHQHQHTLTKPSRGTPVPSIEDIFFRSRQSSVAYDSDDAENIEDGDGRGTLPRDSSSDGDAGAVTCQGASSGEQNNPEIKFLDVSVWLEAVDPKHRYSKSLKKYFCFWQQQQLRMHKNPEDHEDFFTWLDFGGGRSVDLAWCPRRVLEQRRVKYMTATERSYFEVLVKGGVLRWRTTGKPCHTRVGWLQRVLSKKIIRSGTWIFVLSHDGRLFVGQKMKGRLHHSSFMAGAPTLASGNIHVDINGVLKSISPKSGHYRPNVADWRAALKDFFTAGGIEDGGESAFRV